MIILGTPDFGLFGAIFATVFMIWAFRLSYRIYKGEA
jgi:hypothetical protein